MQAKYPFGCDDEVACLGQGRFSKVLCVRNREEKDTGFVAVKRYSRDIDAARMDRIAQERRVLEILSGERIGTGLSQCPYLVQLISTYKDDKWLYIVQTAVLGGSLHKHIPPCGLSPTVTRGVIAELISALSHLQKHYCIHRDLKASNIVLNHRGHPVICDFGSAKLLRSPDPPAFVADVLGNFVPVKAAKNDYPQRTFTLTGSLHCMSPEMAAGCGHGLQVDFWALGVLLHEMICGGPPEWTHRPEIHSMEALADTDMALLAREALSEEKNDCKLAAEPNACWHWGYTRGGGESSEVWQASPLTVAAASVVSGLLCIKPDRRLTLRDLEVHPFFEKVVWKDVHSGMSPSPWGGGMDQRLGFLDLIEKLSDTSEVGADDNLTEEQQKLFEGF